MTSKKSPNHQRTGPREVTTSELQGLEQHFVTFLEKTTDFIYFKDIEGRFLFCSQTMADITGRASWRDLVGKRDRDVFPAETAAIYEAQERPLLETGQPILDQTQHYFAEDGEKRWVQTYKWPVTSPSGELLGLFGISRDITELRRSLAELRDSQQRLDTAGHLAWDLVYEWDTEDDRLTWYGQIDAILGLEPGTIQPTFDDWFSRVHPDDAPRIRTVLERHARDVEPFELEYRIQHADGGWRFWHERARPLLGEADSAQRWIGVCTDVTDVRIADEYRTVTRSVFEHAGEGIVVTTSDGTISYVNAAFERVTGFTREEAIGQNPRMLKSGLHDATFYASMWSSLAEQGHWSGEIWNRRKNGEVYPQRLTISAVKDPGGRPLQYVAVCSDITTQKEQEARLEYLAQHDPLTGLPNRALLDERLQRAMARADRDGCFMAVAYLDLDGFKDLNDAHGHDVGDDVLVAISRRFESLTRGADTVARLGGDEFVFLFEGLDTPSAVHALGHRILEAVRTPVHVGGACCRPTHRWDSLATRRIPPPTPTS